MSCDRCDPFASLLLSLGTKQNHIGCHTDPVRTPASAQSLSGNLLLDRSGSVAQIWISHRKSLACSNYSSHVDLRHIMLHYSLEKELTLEGRVHALAFSPSGQYLAIALNDRVCVWDTTTWALDLRFYRDSVLILSVAWNVNNQLFFGCDRGFLTMVSWEERVCEQSIILRSTYGRLLQEYHSQGFRATAMEVRFIAISSDTRYLALGGGGEVTIWEMGKCIIHKCSPKLKVVSQLATKTLDQNGCLSES